MGKSNWWFLKSHHFIWNFELKPHPMVMHHEIVYMNESDFEEEIRFRVSPDNTLYQTDPVIPVAFDVTLPVWPADRGDWNYRHLWEYGKQAGLGKWR